MFAGLESKLFAGLAILAVIGGLCTISFFKGAAYNEAGHTEKALAASEKARETEHITQKGVDNALQKQNDELRATNNQLASDLNELRNRASRRMSKTTQPDCSGAYPAELSREDAELVTKGAAEADKIRAALKACYAYADEIENFKRQPK